MNDRLRTAPGPPRGVPFVGSAVMLQRDPIGRLTKLARQYGGIVQMRLLNRPAFLITDPDHVRDVLVTRQQNFTKTPTYQRMRPLFGDGLLTAEGEVHKRHRRLVQPAFSRESLTVYGAIMSRYSSQARDRFAPGEEIDVHREMMRLALAIITCALFGADVEGEAKQVGRAMSELEETFRIVALPFAGILRRLPLERNRRADKILADVRALVDRQIEEHRASPERHKDLLSTLLHYAMRMERLSATWSFATK